MMYSKFWEMLSRAPEGEGGDPAPAEAPAEQTEAVTEAEPQTAEAEPEEPEGQVEQPKGQQGLLNRISQLTRQKRELEERLAAQAPQSQESQPTLTPEAIQAEINRRAEQVANQKTWLKETEKVWNDGLKKYPDWGAQLHQMAAVLGEIPQSLTEAAIETGEPVEVLYKLAQNLDEATRIALLPPARQGAAIAKLASAPAAKKVSSAPPPIAPKVAGAGAVPKSIDDPNISMEEWAKLRMEQKAARRR